MAEGMATYVVQSGSSSHKKPASEMKPVWEDVPHARDRDSTASQERRDARRGQWHQSEGKWHTLEFCSQARPGSREAKVSADMVGSVAKIGRKSGIIRHD